MANKELVDYVEKGLKRGGHVKHIKRKLVQAGHPVQEIEEAVRHVLLTKPHLKKMRHKLFAGAFVVAAIILMFITLFTFEEKEKITTYKENVTFSQMTDIQLIMYAANNNDMKACEYIRNHNTFYACLDKYWERGDCSYERIIGTLDECYFNKAKEGINFSYCYMIGDMQKRKDCLAWIYSAIDDSGNDSLCQHNSDCLYSVVSLKFGVEGIDLRQNIDSSSIRETESEEELLQAAQKVAEISFDFCSNFNEPAYDDCIIKLSVIKSYINSSGSEGCSLVKDINKRYHECMLMTMQTFDTVLTTCEENFRVRIAPTLGASELAIVANATSPDGRFRCFVNNAFELVRKNIYTCTDLFTFVESKQDVRYFAGFKQKLAEYVNMAYPEESAAPHIKSCLA
ncbi:MAG: hypothetical protein KJ574_04035 [Nanoarchaeota archaeon]|nr:hypothetical protein [Nanoarchaeota archaeon]